MVVWQKECRELKENFSNRWRSKGPAMADFKGHVFIGDARKWLKDASVGGIDRRRAAYRPSPIARRYFQSLAASSTAWSSWLPSIPEVDSRHAQPRRGRRQLPRQVFQGDPHRGRQLLAFYDRPDGRGLRRGSPAGYYSLAQSRNHHRLRIALYNVLKVKNDARRQHLKEHEPRAVRQFQSAVAARLDRFADRAAQAVLDDLMPAWKRSSGLGIARAAH